MYMDLTLLRVAVRIGYGRAISTGRCQGGIAPVIIVIVVMMITTIMVVVVMSDVVAIMRVGKAGE